MFGIVFHRLWLIFLSLNKFRASLALVDLSEFLFLCSRVVCVCIFIVVKGAVVSVNSFSLSVLQNIAYI